jgi:hypothetical protein
MRGTRPQTRLVPTVGILIAIALSIASPAWADVGQTIIQRCGKGESLSGFSQSDYAKALKEISATTEEYSECGQLIRQAKASAASHRPGSSGGSSGAVPTQAVLATPAEQKSIAHAAKAGSEPVSLGDHVVNPGVVHANVASALSTLPTPVLVLLAFLLACLLAVGGGVLRRRIRDGRTD